MSGNSQKNVSFIAFLTTLRLQSSSTNNKEGRCNKYFGVDKIKRKMFYASIVFRFRSCHDWVRTDFVTVVSPTGCSLYLEFRALCARQVVRDCFTRRTNKFAMRAKYRHSFCLSQAGSQGPHLTLSAKLTRLLRQLSKDLCWWLPVIHNLNFPRPIWLLKGYSKGSKFTI